MNLISAKSLNDIRLSGVTFDWVKEDKGIKEVIIRDIDGAEARIKIAATYSDTLKVLIPQPLETADRFLLEGKFLGLMPVKEVFEHEHEANDKLREYSDAAGYGKDVGLTVKRVKAKVTDGGTVKAVVTDDGDVPF